MSAAVPLRPARLGVPAPLKVPAHSRWGRWLALSALLHAAGLASVLAWVSRHESVSIEPIPIAWVRVEWGEDGAGSGDVASSARPPAVVVPPAPEPPPRQRPERESRAPRRTPALPAPAPASTGSEKPDGAGAQSGAPEAGEASGIPAVAMQSGGEQGGGSATGTGRGRGVDDSAAGIAAGWMPRGGAQPPPSYPEAARRRGVEGIAHVALCLAATGSVDDVRLRRSAGDGQLDGAALAAVRRWRFDAPPPGADWRGRWFVVPIEFRLR